MKEAELRNPVKKLFVPLGYEVFDEPTLFARGIDLVAKRGDEVVSIELKLADWKRAIAQAYLDLRVSDYCYVAMPLKALTPTVRAEASRLGIGLLGVEEAAHIVLPPKPSAMIQPLLRARFLAKL